MKTQMQTDCVQGCRDVNNKLSHVQRTKHQYDNNWKNWNICMQTTQKDLLSQLAFILIVCYLYYLVEMGLSVEY